MSELPASVRVALWVTDAWRRGVPTADGLARALPDVDHVAGDVGVLDLWHEMGEGALLVALPAAGDFHGMPRAADEATAAVVDAGECVLAPGIGGLLVPLVSSFGVGEGADVGTRLDFMSYDADPVPRHAVEALDAGAVERRFREQVATATEDLGAIGGQPFAGRLAREAADAALEGSWGLPEALPVRAHRVLRTAAAVGSAAALAMDMPDDSLDVTTSGRRAAVLAALERAAERATGDATNLCVAHVAGWVPSVR